MDSKSSRAKTNTLLMFAAAIWGFAFVAQRAGMEHVGPFLFNGVRFAMGSAVLVPVLLLVRARATTPEAKKPSWPSRHPVLGALLAGGVLFAGASLQQVGLVYTTAGKGGFITGLYVVIVPVLGLFLGQWPGARIWLGALLAGVGLYFLSVKGGLEIEKGDLLVLGSALCWAVHVQVIGWLVRGVGAIFVAAVQFAVCSILSLAVAMALELWVWSDILAACIPILYAGLLSTGVAYTLQVVAQKRARPAHAAIILSLEAVFAALGGWVVLSEVMGPRNLFGCALMLAGMLLAQLGRKSESKAEGSNGRE